MFTRKCIIRGMKAVIYKMEFPNGDFYIGSSRHFAERRRTHLRHMKKGLPVNKLVGGAYSAAGLPTFVIVATCLQVSDAHVVEASVIEALTPTLNVAKPVKPPPEDSPACTPFGPYSSLAAAARGLGVTYRQIKYLSKKHSFDDLAAGRHVRAQTTKKQSAMHWRTPVTRHPPDPRKDRRLEFLDGRWDYKWVFRKERSVKMARPKRLVAISGTEMDLDTAAEMYAVPKHLITQRLSCGWTPEEAVGIALSPRQRAAEASKLAAAKVERDRRERYCVTFAGEVVNLGELCKRLQLSRAMVKRQLDRGVSIEAAIDYSQKMKVGVALRKELYGSKVVGL